MFQPSSLFTSSLPVGFKTVNVSVAGSNDSMFVESAERTNVPFARTMPITSPRLPPPKRSVSCDDHELDAGS
jgi:hypothetical protein